MVRKKEIALKRCRVEDVIRGVTEQGPQDEQFSWGWDIRKGSLQY